MLAKMHDWLAWGSLMGSAVLPLGAIAALDAGAHPLRTASDLDPLVAAMAESRVVLLGEATHGTHEFYDWRATITRRLVTEHGFRIVAVEGDWAPLYQLNNYIKHRPGAGDSAAAVLAGLTRWPQWMWANHETAQLAEHLRDWNAGRPAAEQVGFYGMDAYAPWEAARLVLDYLREHRPAEWRKAEQAYIPLLNPRSPEQAFMRGSALLNPRERAAVEAVATRLGSSPPADARGTAGWFSAWQGAKVVLRAKTHFRTSSAGGAESWNVRARHMHETVLRLLEARGDGSKAVVWAHNTHIGDARATSMSHAGMVNLGETTRRHFAPGEVFALGFATHAGEVVAGRSWGARREIMTIPPADPTTLEGRLAALNRGDLWLDLRDPALAETAELRQVLPHRAIGVVYQPEHDAQRNFVPTVLGARYDALIFIARTTALHLLE